MSPPGLPEGAASHRGTKGHRAGSGSSELIEVPAVISMGGGRGKDQQAAKQMVPGALKEAKELAWTSGSTTQA